MRGSIFPTDMHRAVAGSVIDNQNLYVESIEYRSRNAVQDVLECVLCLICDDKHKKPLTRCDAVGRGHEFPPRALGGDSTRMSAD
jgi:hypothetical protein